MGVLLFGLGGAGTIIRAGIKRLRERSSVERAWFALRGCMGVKRSGGVG